MYAIVQAKAVVQERKFLKDTQLLKVLHAEAIKASCGRSLAASVWPGPQLLVPAPCCQNMVHSRRLLLLMHLQRYENKLAELTAQIEDLNAQNSELARRLAASEARAGEPGSAQLRWDASPGDCAEEGEGEQEVQEEQQQEEQPQQLEQGEGEDELQDWALPTPQRGPLDLGAEQDGNMQAADSAVTPPRTMASNQVGIGERMCLCC